MPRTNCLTGSVKVSIVIDDVSDLKAMYHRQKEKEHKRESLTMYLTIRCDGVRAILGLRVKARVDGTVEGLS